MQLTIAVTESHIDHGVRLRSDACPVALAADDAFPGYRVIAGCFWIRWRDPDTDLVRFKAAPPREFDIFMQTYDNGGTVQPIAATVELIEIPRIGKG